MEEFQNQDLKDKINNADVESWKWDILSLLNDAKKIIDLFKNKWNNDDFYKIEESYDELIKSYKKALEDNKIETKNALNELKWKTELQDIREKWDRLKKLVWSTSLNYLVSTDFINWIKYSEIKKEETQYIFAYLKDNPSNLYFINNKDFINEYLKNSDDSDKDTIFSNLPTELKKDNVIILTYIKYSNNKSLSQIPWESLGDMINSFFNDNKFKNFFLELLVDNKLVINLVLKVKELNSKKTMENLIEFFISYLHEKSLEFIPKKIILENKNFILELFKQDKLDISEIDTKLSQKILLPNIDINNPNFNEINIFISENWVTNEIKSKIYELIEKWYFWNLESLHNDKDFILEYINKKDSNIANIIQYLTYDIKSDNDVIKSVIRNRDSIDYLYLFDINDVDTLNKVYLTLRNNNISPKVIFANDKFRDQVEKNIYDKKLDDIVFTKLKKEYFESEEFFAERYLALNTLILKTRKEDILKILINDFNFDSKKAEEFFSVLLTASLSVDNIRSNFKNIWWYFIKWEDDKEWVDKLKSFMTKLYWLKYETIKDKSVIDGYFEKIIESVDMKSLTQENTKISDFITWSTLDLDKIRSGFKKFKINNPKKEWEWENEYEFRIINEFLDSIFINDKWLSRNEAKVKYIFSEVIKNIFYEKKIETEYKLIKTNPDLFVKYISSNPETSDWKKIEDEYKNTYIKTSNQIDNTLNSQSYLIPEITKTESWYTFTTTNESWKEVKLPITNYEAALINWSERTKENFKKFSETLSELNLLKLWKYREWIFKSIAEKNWITFNVNDDFLKEEEIKLFLSSIVKSVWKEFSDEEKKWSLESLKIKIKLVNNNDDIIKWEKNSNIKWESKIEELFRLKYVQDDWTFLQDKFKQYI